MNVQFTSYRAFEGRRLDDESIAFYLRHEDCCTVVLLPVPPRIRSRVGGQRHPLEPTSARILRLVTAVAPRVHTFSRDNPDADQIVHRTGHATGIGDIVLRSKYRFLRAPGGGLAARVDVRLPTGDERDLLGAGGVQSKLQLIASTEHGRFGQHVNAGYTWTSGRAGGTVFSGLPSQDIPNEVNYAGGITFAATPRMTLVADVVGRTLRNLGRLDAVTTVVGVDYAF